MHYVYILESIATPGHYYIGYTAQLGALRMSGCLNCYYVLKFKYMNLAVGFDRQKILDRLANL